MEFSDFSSSGTGSFDVLKALYGSVGEVGDRHVLSSQHSKYRSSATMPSVLAAVPVSSRSSAPFRSLEMYSSCSKNRKYTPSDKGAVWQGAADVRSLAGTDDLEPPLVLLQPASLPLNSETAAAYSRRALGMELLQLVQFKSYANTWDSGYHNHKKFPLTQSLGKAPLPVGEVTEIPISPSLSIWNATESLPEYSTNNTDQSLESEQINPLGMETPDWTEEAKEMFAQLQEVADAMDKPNINGGVAEDAWFSDQAAQTQSACTGSDVLFSLKTEANDSLSDSELESIVASSVSNEQLMLNSSPVADFLESWASGGAGNPAASHDQSVKPSLLVTKQPPQVDYMYVEELGYPGHVPALFL